MRGCRTRQLNPCAPAVAAYSGDITCTLLALSARKVRVGAATLNGATGAE